MLENKQNKKDQNEEVFQLFFLSKDFNNPNNNFY